jgi:hypothetical protein
VRAPCSDPHVSVRWSLVQLSTQEVGARLRREDARARRRRRSVHGATDHLDDAPARDRLDPCLDGCGHLRAEEAGAQMHRPVAVVLVEEAENRRAHPVRERPFEQSLRGGVGPHDRPAPVDDDGVGQLDERIGHGAGFIVGSALTARRFPPALRSGRASIDGLLQQSCSLRAQPLRLPRRTTPLLSSADCCAGMVANTLQIGPSGRSVRAVRPSVRASAADAAGTTHGVGALGVLCEVETRELVLGADP